MLAPLDNESVPETPDRLLTWTSRAAQRRNISSLNDAIDRRDFEAHLTAARYEHPGFQRLVAKVSSCFAEAAPDAIEKAIGDALPRIAEALQLDEASVWRKLPEDSAFAPLRSWVRPPATSRSHIPASSIPWVMSRLDEGLAAFFTRVSEVPVPCDRVWLQEQGMRSGAILPLGATGAGVSVLIFGSMTRECEITPAVLDRLRLVAGLVGQALGRRDAHEALGAAQDEVRRLRARLGDAQEPARREMRSVRSSRIIVSESAAIRRALFQMEQVAPTPATVLLLGETGSGKEVFAQTIHDLSPRHQRPMIKVSCGAIPSALIESELFGRERGAYTGALSRQIGRFEAAHQSTIFLDEIGELPAEVQVKLLRVLQERVVERLGSNHSTRVDVRIVAATNRNLEEAIENKSFREDLFYRLNVFPIVVPPLRERVEDIPDLAWAFIDELSKSFGKSITSISRDSIRDLQRYPWPGNVRELRNIIERAVIVATGPVLEVSTPRPPVRVPQTAMKLVDLEIEHIRAALEITKWRVRGAGGAAERLGLKPTTLESRMARLGLNRLAPGSGQRTAESTR